MGLLTDGRHDEAEAMALEVEETSAAADIVNFGMTRAIRARVAAARGELELAEQLARESEDFGNQTDFPMMHGGVIRVARSRVRRAGQGRRGR